MKAIRHTSVQRGKRVKVYFHDGRTIIARFKERKSSTIHFFDHSSLTTREIYNLAIYKGNPTSAP